MPKAAPILTTMARPPATTNRCRQYGGVERERGVFCGRSAKAFFAAHRKQDALFLRLPGSRKMTGPLSWAVVYESHRPYCLFIGQPGKIPPSGKEPPQQAVALFVQRTFPRTARMAEATFSLKGLIGLPEAEECLAPAIGRRRRYGPDPGSRRKSTPATPGASFRESRYPRVRRTKKENVRRRSLFLCIDAVGRQRGLSPKPVSAVPCPLPATRARPPRACPASPDGDRQPAIRPPSLPPLPSSPVKRVGEGMGVRGKGETLARQPRGLPSPLRTPGQQPSIP